MAPRLMEVVTSILFSLYSALRMSDRYQKYSPKSSDFNICKPTDQYFTRERRFILPALTVDAFASARLRRHHFHR
jgi:hypothetical protein